MVPRAIAAVVAAIALASCRADARIQVTLTSSGAGAVAATLVLDRQAVAVVGDKVDLTDLAQEGWVVTGPVRAPDGSESVTVTHPFRTPAEGTALLARLGQPVHLTVLASRGALSSTVGLRGSVDLRGGVDAVAGQVAGLPGGASAALGALARAGGTVPTFSLQVSAALPGKPTAVVGRGTVAGATVTWDTPMGAQTVLGARTTHHDAAARRWLAAAVVLALAFIVVVGVEAFLAVRRRPG
jgi:hypothetical protein